MEDIYEVLTRLRRRGEKAVLATVVDARGSTPRKQGAKMIVQADGRITGTIGGGTLEHQVIQAALERMDGKETRMLHFEMTDEDASQEGMICGGSVDVFIEPLAPLPILYLFGGGHISLSLARLAKMVDFRLVVVDDRDRKSVV